MAKYFKCNWYFFSKIAVVKNTMIYFGDTAWTHTKETVVLSLLLLNTVQILTQGKKANNILCIFDNIFYLWTPPERVSGTWGSWATAENPCLSVFVANNQYEPLTKFYEIWFSGLQRIFPKSHESDNTLWQCLFFYT